MSLFSQEQALEAVTIHDVRPLSGGQVLAVDLIDILRLCESDVLVSSWRLRDVDCLGDLADEFMRLGESEATVSGPELVRLASGVYQVIEGEFEAYHPGEATFWLVVRAIDSTLYVVITEDQDLLARVRARFRDVRPLPEDAEYA
jgi:hypothetical protein